ncbi:MAG: hypothetical protein ABIR24_01135 [Verrucomicrobiota bacterium]
MRFRLAVLVFTLATIFSGCATANLERASRPRVFDFEKDSFGYPNELVWEYFFDTEGKWKSRRREPKPDYTHHCFVVAHSAKQFFQNAQFVPEKPLVDEVAYRELVHQVVSRGDPSNGRKIIFPGYANLREFSLAEETLLKEECGGAWKSYFQRGHWRMMLPFSRRHQKATSKSLIESIARNRLAVVHLVRFPQLTINHAIVLFDFRDSGQGIEFDVYDPNKPDQPGKLTFDRVSQTFKFPANDYFIGGKVNVYEIYRSCFY